MTTFQCEFHSHCEILTENLIARSIQDPETAAKLRKTFADFFEKCRTMDTKFEVLKRKLEETELKLEESQSEVEAFKTAFYENAYKALVEYFNCSICNEIFFEVSKR